jgi:hypothetical protein
MDGYDAAAAPAGFVEIAQSTENDNNAATVAAGMALHGFAIAQSGICETLLMQVQTQSCRSWCVFQTNAQSIDSRRMQRLSPWTHARCYCQAACLRSLA